MTAEPLGYIVVEYDKTGQPTDWDGGYLHLHPTYWDAEAEARDAASIAGERFTYRVAAVALIEATT